MWFAVSAIASAGWPDHLPGASLKRRARGAGAWTGIACSTAFTLWAVLTKGAKPVINLAPFNFPYDDLTIGALGNIILFATGWLASLLMRSSDVEATGTFWHWRKAKRHRVEQE